MNYHRVMLQVLTWAVRLGELNNQPLNKAVYERLSHAAEFLFEMIDPNTGRGPNYGANDGALVLPLDGCGYQDYRPAVQVAGVAAEGRRWLSKGPWEEPLIWLFGPYAMERPTTLVKSDSRRFDIGGYYTLRATESWCMIRCHTYRDRPSHCDLLHLDLWWQGINVLRDAGTFSYFAPENLELIKYFSSTVAHNTIEIDGQPPMKPVSRFVKLPWPRCRTIFHNKNRWQGEHYAYNRAPWNVIHRRLVEKLSSDGWKIKDELLGDGNHDLILRWHLPWGEWQWDNINHNMLMLLGPGKVVLSFNLPDGCETNLIIGDHDDPRPPAIESIYYQSCEPQSIFELKWSGHFPVNLTTRIKLRART